MRRERERERETSKPIHISTSNSIILFVSGSPKEKHVIDSTHVTYSTLYPQMSSSYPLYMQIMSFPSILAQDYVDTKDVSKTKLHQQQKPGEVSVKVQVVSYKGTFSNETRQYVDQDECPATVTKTAPAKIPGGKATSYPIKIPVVAKVRSMTEIPGTCELQPDGGYLVTSKVAYLSTNDTGDPLFSDWVKANAKRVYDDSDPIVDAKDRAVLKNIIAPTGEIGDTTKALISTSYPVTLKCKDATGSKSLFRQNYPDSTAKKVVPRTNLNATNVEFVSWVRMQKTTVPVPGATDGSTTVVYTPKVSYWLAPGKVELAEGEERYKDPAAKMRDTENPNNHMMAYAPHVKDGSVKIPAAGYMLIQNRYSTPAPVQHPDGKGISIIVDEAEKPSDVVYTAQDGTKVKKVTHDITVYQWIGDPVDGKMEKFRATLNGGKKSNELANKFGIIDPDTYAKIKWAHPNITFHAMVVLWWAATFNNNPSNNPSALEADPTKTRGYYTYGIEDLVPDYQMYFEKLNGALQLSKEMCATIFENEIGTIKKTGATQLTLASTEPMNPVNVAGPQSDVLLLGRPDYHVYNGDAWSAVSTGRVYVMTNYKLKPEERMTMCGANADTAAADEKFKLLLKTPGFTYMVFVAQPFDEAPVKSNVGLVLEAPSDPMEVEDPIEEFMEEEEEVATPPPAIRKSKKKKKKKQHSPTKRKVEEVLQYDEEEEEVVEEVEEDPQEDSPPPAPRKKKKRKAPRKKK